jgi:hypothetical protein
LGNQLGNFGQVWLGTCRGMTVAVKKLHVQVFDQQTIEDFKKEVTMMVYVNDLNLYDSFAIVLLHQRTNCEQHLIP